VRSIWPNVSGVLQPPAAWCSPAYADGSLVAYDDTTLDELWKVNVGSVSSPADEPSRPWEAVRCDPLGASAPIEGRLTLTPELREMRQPDPLFVFGL